MYSKPDSPYNICGFVIVHMDDLLYTWAVGFLALVRKTISQFRAGAVEVATREKGIPLRNWRPNEGHNNSFIIPQETHGNAMPLMDISRYVGREKLKNVGGLKSTLRQFPGPSFGFIRPNQPWVY